MTNFCIVTRSALFVLLAISTLEPTSATNHQSSPHSEPQRNCGPSSSDQSGCYNAEQLDRANPSNTDSPLSTRSQTAIPPTTGSSSSETGLNLYSVFKKLSQSGREGGSAFLQMITQILSNIAKRGVTAPEEELNTTAPTSIASTTALTSMRTTGTPLFRFCFLGNCRVFSRPSTPTAPTPRQCFPAQCGRPIFPLSTPSPMRTRPFKKVVGGTRAEPFSHPWTAMLAKKEQSRTFYCGAVVICSHWVLTVAHCMNRQSIETSIPDLNPSFYTVYAGRHVGWNLKFGKQVQVFEGRRDIRQLLQHEDFVPGVSRGVIPNDIGLIRLRRPILFNRYVQPACLSSNPPAVNEVLWATGWGNTNNVGPDSSSLKQVALKIHNESVCNERVLQFNESQTSGLLCAGGERNQDTCIGDSGGPLVGLQSSGVNGMDRRWLLYGLTNLGSPSCNTSPSDQQPSLYINISHFLSWIQERTQSCCLQ